MFSYKVADFLIRIQNGQQQKLEFIYVLKSKLILNLLKTLLNLGYIRGYTQISKKNTYFIKVFLKYDEKNLPVIKRLACISKPSRRVYITTKMLMKFNTLNLDHSILILSTTKGILSHVEALKLNIGGEVLCKIK